MRTRETVLLGAAFLLALAPLALAQEEDPTLNESDFDTSPPPSDERYLDEGAQDGADPSGAEASTTSEPDPTLGEGDFDMSAPDEDMSYLGDDAASDAAGSTAGATTDAGRSAVPAPGIVAALGVLALAALALRRRG